MAVDQRRHGVGVASIPYGPPGAPNLAFHVATPFLLA
jgi:hypothetical protein